MPSLDSNQARDYAASLRKLHGQVDVLDTRLTEAERVIERLEAQVAALSDQIAAIRGGVVAMPTVTHLLIFTVAVLAISCLLRFVPT